MRVVPNLAQEFEEMCASYSSVDQRGKDLVSLVSSFGDEYDHLSDQDSLELFAAAWAEFLEEHKHQVTVMPMLGLVLYILVTYWHAGQTLFDALPTLEKMVIRDTVSEISEEINRRSAENGRVIQG